MHDIPADSPAYCRANITRRNGKTTPIARNPTEAAQGRPVGYALPDTTSADRPDRTWANKVGAPVYALTHDGWLLRISPVANDSLPNPQTFYRVFGGTAAQQKCSWLSPKR